MYAKGYGENYGQVADAIKSVVQNIDGMANAATSDLESIGSKALNVAQIFDKDLGEVTRTVAQLIKTGLAANASEAFDLITAGIQRGADKSGDLLDTLNEYPTQFRDLGLTGQQALGLISQGLQAGARDSDIVADALKEFTIRAKDGTKTTAEGFAALGLSAAEMSATIARGGPAAAGALDVVLDRLRAIEDPVKRSQVAVQLFGTQAEDLQQALFALDPSSAVAALGSVAGAADQAGKSFHDNAQAKIDAFLRTISTGFVTVIGGYVLPLVEKLAGFLVTNFGPAFSLVASVVTGGIIPALSAMGRFVADNESWLRIVAGVITALFVPALIQMGVTSTINGAKSVAAWVSQTAASISSTIAQSGNVVRLVAGWIALGASATWNAAVVVAGWVAMGVQSLINAAKMAAAWVLAMGPVGWIIAAVVALVALIIANWDTVKQWTVTAWEAVWGFIKQVGQWIWDYFLKWSVPGLIITHWDTIVAAVRTAVGWVLSAVDWLGSLPGKVGAWFAGVYWAAVGKLAELLAWVRGLPGSLLAALGDFGGLLSRLGGDLLSGLWRGIQGSAGWLRDRIFGFFRGLMPDWVRDALGIASPSRVMAGIGRWIPPGIADGIRSTASTATNAALAVADDMTAALANFAASRDFGVNLISESPYTPTASAPFTPRRDTPDPAQTAAPVRQEVTVNVATNADPHQIGSEVAWAIRTGGR